MTGDSFPIRDPDALSQDPTANADERARLAQHLHDGLAQDLWFMNVQVKRLQDALEATQFAQATALATELRQALERLHQDVRALMQSLQQPADSLDFVAELTRLSDDPRLRSGSSVVLEVDLDETTRPSTAVATRLTRVVREALVNIAKHARASSVHIRVSAEGESLRIVIADNGRGFDPTQRRDPRQLGIRSMRERMQAMGGKLVIRSAPGHGTTLYVRAPLALDWDRNDPAVYVNSATDLDWESREVAGAPAAG